MKEKTAALETRDQRPRSLHIAGTRCPGGCSGTERDCFQFLCFSTRELNSSKGASSWPSLGHVPALVPPSKDLLCFVVQHILSLPDTTNSLCFFLYTELMGLWSRISLSFARSWACFSFLCFDSEGITWGIEQTKKFHYGDLLRAQHNESNFEERKTWLLIKHFYRSCLLGTTALL